MGKIEETREALGRFAGQYGPQQSALYTVMSVNEGEQSLIAEDDDQDKHLIRISPIITSGQSILLYPATGKKILANRFEDSGDWFVSWAEQYYKVSITIGECTFESDGSKWTINNDSANIIDIFNKIIQAVQVVVVLMGNNPDYAKLEEAQTLVNTLFQ